MSAPIGLEPFYALDIAHAGNAAQAGDDALHVLEVFNFEHHVDGRLAVGGAGFDVADVGVVVADDGGDLLEHAFAVVTKNRELHRVPTGRVATPFNRNLAVGLVHQVGHVGTRSRVHGHAFATRDIADDVFATNGIAASRSIHHKVTVSPDLDGSVAAAAKDATDHTGNRTRLWLFRSFSLGLELLGGFRCKLAKHLTGRELAIAEAGEEVVDSAEAIFGGDPVEGRVFDALERNAIATRFFFDQLAANLDGALAFVLIQPVFDFLPRARRPHEAQPVAAGG